jgi:hypothetical protein
MLCAEDADSKLWKLKEKTLTEDFFLTGAAMVHGLLSQSSERMTSPVT